MYEKLREIWNSLITGFCKVDFVCYTGEPNWLGWIVLAIGAVIVLSFCATVGFFILALVMGTIFTVIEKIAIFFRDHGRFFEK